MKLAMLKRYLIKIWFNSYEADYDSKYINNNLHDSNTLQ
jgi:hypothetical protein